MSPNKVEYSIGSNIHGQPIRLIYEKGSSGQFSWTIHRDQANQRDDSKWIGGLTDKNILDMAEAVKGAA